MELISSSNSRRKFESSSLVELIQSSLPNELNIYNQAHLEIDTPAVLAKTVHPKTTNEIGVNLNLTGEITGSITCLLDTFDKDISETETLFFKSLFIESINIFIGQLITSLDNNYNIQAMISTPEFVEKSETLELSYSEDKIIIGVGYKFISIHNEFDSRFIINIKKTPEERC